MAFKLKHCIVILCGLSVFATATVWAAPVKPVVNRPPANAGKGSVPGKRVFYKYRDDTGELVLKDFLPPEVVARGYTVVNEFGQTLEVVEPAKTHDQLLADKKAKEERDAVERAHKDAAKHDAELLRQYTAVDDVMRARDTQLSAVDVQISIRTGSNNLLTTQLEAMQAHAADFERRAQPVPAQVLKNIADSQRQLKDNQAFIALQTKEKEKISERFKLDIVRFKELQAQRVLRGRNDDGSTSMPLTTLVGCSGSEQCQKAWQAAQIYARDNASRSLEIITDTIVLTGKPVSEHDIAMSLSKVQDKGETQQIMLEISCTASDPGADTCAGEHVKELLAKFPTFVSAHIK